MLKEEPHPPRPLEYQQPSTEASVFRASLMLAATFGLFCGVTVLCGFGRFFEWPYFYSTFLTVGLPHLFLFVTNISIATRALRRSRWSTNMMWGTAIVLLGLQLIAIFISALMLMFSIDFSHFPVPSD